MGGRKVFLTSKNSNCLFESLLFFIDYYRLPGSCTNDVKRVKFLRKVLVEEMRKQPDKYRWLIDTDDCPGYREFLRDEIGGNLSDHTFALYCQFMENCPRAWVNLKSHISTLIK